MPDVARAVSGIPRADPGGRVTPRFGHRLIRFRHFCSGSLALASLDRACRNLVPAFPQRSPPRLLPAAACGGLRSAPDHRTRRALLHLSYSCAPQITHTTLVTHDPLRSFLDSVVEQFAELTARLLNLPRPHFGSPVQHEQNLADATGLVNIGTVPGRVGGSRAHSTPSPPGAAAAQISHKGLMRVISVN